MKIKTVKASYGVTINMGDFNSVRLDLELEAEVQQGDDIQKVIADTQNKVFKEVNDRANKIKQAQAKAKQGN